MITLKDFVQMKNSTNINDVERLKVLRVLYPNLYNYYLGVFNFMKGCEKR